MEIDASEIPEPVKIRKPKHDTTNKQIRGSSLLLFGRLLSTGINFASQVLIVRSLSKGDFGAFAYGLSIVAFFQGISGLGLRRGITRFLPMYHEKEDYDKITGTLLLVLAVLILLSSIIIFSVHLFPEQIARLVKDKDQPVDLLLVLIFLVPVESFDTLLVSLFACFTSPRAIFARKHIMAPLFRLATVLLLVFFNANSIFLAYGYLISGALGILIFIGMFIHLLYRQNVLQKLKLRTANVPAKELFAFALPLLSTDLVTIVMHQLDTMLLGYYHDAAQVGAFRAILPAAHFNKIPMESFAILFTPLAARLFAKNDFHGINDLYWRTAIWMSIVSFPIFALTFSLAKPITVFLYGARYESSWLFLNLLSFGYYFNLVTGFNGLTLKVLGKIRYVVTINFVAMFSNLVLAFLLIPKYGALGAAISTTAAMVFHNFLKQAGLRLASGLSVFEWKYLSFYLILVGSAAGLFLVQLFITKNFFILVALTGIVTFLIFMVSKERLKVEETFPELLKIPLVRFVLNVKKPKKNQQEDARDDVKN
jgi:O-antigen/teichoic acid export membrane protein